MRPMKKLQSLRKAKKLTQSELAKQSCLSRNSIFNYEKGIRSPKMSDLLEITKVLGCTIEEIIEDN